MTYQPDDKILKKYAEVLVKFALWGGSGIKPGEAVYIRVPECAKPIIIPLQDTILEMSGHPYIEYVPNGTDRHSSASRHFLEKASMEQVKYIPENYIKARVEDFTHFIAIISDYNPHDFKGVDGKKLMERNKAASLFLKERSKKEDAGKASWTLALYGTEGMAKEAGLTIEEYWDQIIAACFLDMEDPVSEWQAIMAQTNETKAWLDSLEIEKVHVKGADVDLELKIGADRKWLGGSGRNIPSFELFVSPDWRGSNGWIRFNQPLYRFGNLVKGIELEFKDGVITKASAKENEQVLLDMIEVENADKVGEFSMTDKKHSRITKFMANTLYDENVGGEFGNTHIALGRAYHDSYKGDSGSVNDEQWKEMGYNDSAIHTDIISTADRTVTAELSDGSTKVIYRNGEFQR
jgi:aminopeptidase